MSSTPATMPPLPPLPDTDAEPATLLRFGSADAEFLVAVGQAGEGWLRPIPVGSGECGISGDAVACATPDGAGLAVNLPDGADAPAGDYPLDEAPEPVTADNLAGEVALPEGAAELNGFGDDRPRWVVDGGIVIIALPDGIVALDLGTGEERWRIDAPVDGWSIDDERLYVHHDGVVVVHDLTEPQATDAGPAPTDTVPAPPLDAALAALDGRVFAFSSGAGAWSTTAEFDGEGGFTAVFHDSNATSATRSEFHGRFEVIEQVDERTHRLELVELVVDSPSGTSEVSPEGQRIDFVDMPYGFDEGTEFLLHEPGADGAQLTQEHRVWLRPFGADPGSGPLETAVLINVVTDYAFVEVEAPASPDPEPEPEATEAAPASALDGDWCPTPESNPDYADCFTITGDTVQYHVGWTVQLEVRPADDGSGCSYLTGVAGQGDSGPLGMHCPAGVPIELPDYYEGADHPEVDRIWNAQTGTMHLRR